MTESWNPRQGPRQRNYAGTRSPVMETAFSTVFLVAGGSATCENGGIRFQHVSQIMAIAFFENKLLP